MSIKEKPTLVQLGWNCHDVVVLRKTWCVLCTKSRWFEVYNNQAVCLACCDVVDEKDTKKTFELERFNGR